MKVIRIFTIYLPDFITDNERCYIIEKFKNEISENRIIFITERVKDVKKLQYKYEEFKTTINEN